MQEAADPIVLSYGDHVIRSQDLNILRCPDQWLNDRIIGFYLAYLLRNHTEPTRSGRATFLTLDPSVAQLVKLSHPEMAQVSGGP
ncbi:unnamed protein product, partial [Cyprideis torosa]